MNKDVTVLDEIIQGRVEPYIYAFSTNTFPNYLKVGDTYRSVTERLNEWKKYYPNSLEKYTPFGTLLANNLVLCFSTIKNLCIE